MTGFLRLSWLGQNIEGTQARIQEEEAREHVLDHIDHKFSSSNLHAESSGCRYF